MTWWHAHPDASALVRSHWREAELLLFAQRQPCIAIRQDELAKIDRVMHAVEPDDLRAWAKRSKPRRSWLAAVLLCPGDETAGLAAVVKDLGLDAERFHFYLHEDAKVNVLSGWANAGLPLDAVDEGIADWGALHKRLGLDFNVQIVEDFADDKQ
ncbi:MAG: hypothetical protein QOC71_250 [Thermoplasmata archaeon]|jgi:hypothetical protein|nr:hypothetical protein [Thermoplasmata archaeon]